MTRWLPYLVLVMSVASCNSTATRPTIAPTLAMFLKTDDGRLVRYDLAGNGTLRFAGGKDIMLDRWSWTGSVTPEQGAELKRIVSRSNWASAPRSDQGGNTWEITVREDGGRQKFDVTGDSPDIDAAWAILTDAGRARLQPELDRLPRPDLDALVNRRRVEPGGDAP